MMPTDTWRTELMWLLQASMLVLVMMVVLGILTW